MLTRHEKIEFEKWARTAGLSLAPAFFTPSEYSSTATKKAWLAWLARADFGRP